MTGSTLLIWGLLIAGGAMAIGYLLGDSRQSAKVARAEENARASEVSAASWREKHTALLKRHGRLEVAICKFQEEVAPVLREQD